MPAVSVNPADEARAVREERLDDARRRIPPAMDTLLECSPWLVDVLPEPKSTALRWFLKAWENADTSEPVWYAVMELLSVHDGCFDADMRRAVVDLLAAAADGFAECEGDAESLSLRTYDRMHRAHGRIGAALDRIREEEAAAANAR